MKKAIIMIVVITLICIILAGCVTGECKAPIDKPAGFLWGILHGWIASISLVIGVFNKGVRVYEVINTGWWYDFGFYIAIVGGFGSLAFWRKKRRDID